jgi:hypothetical protein
MSAASFLGMIFLLMWSSQNPASCRILALEFACGKLHLSAGGGEQWKQRHPCRRPSGAIRHPCRFLALEFAFGKLHLSAGGGEH